MNISDSLDQYADICRDAIKYSFQTYSRPYEIYKKYVLEKYFHCSHLILGE